MTSGHVTAWQIQGEKVEIVRDFLFLGSKITGVDDCSHEIRRWLLLSGKAMTNLGSVLKSRDITLPTKIGIVKAMVFPVVMYGCESWTVRKGECQRIDAFELWWWRRLLKVPWTARGSNQSILREINAKYSLGGLMLKLKFQYFGHLMWTDDSLGMYLMLERLRAEEESVSGWDGWTASLMQWTWTWANSGRWWGLACCSPWRCKESDMIGRLNNNNACFSFITLIFRKFGWMPEKFLCVIIVFVPRFYDIIWATRAFLPFIQFLAVFSLDKGKHFQIRDVLVKVNILWIHFKRMWDTR